MSAVEQFEGGVICPHARPVGQYGELAAVADQEVLRGVVGHPPAGTDEAALYLSLVRWLPPFPTPFVPRVRDDLETGSKASKNPP